MISLACEDGGLEAAKEDCLVGKAKQFLTVGHKVKALRALLMSSRMDGTVDGMKRLSGPTSLFA